MKIAVITDIHGNAAALKAVLHDIDDRNDIKHIYCLGDMIGIGYETNEVLEILFSRTDISMITGNHDEAILALLKSDQHPASHSHVLAHHKWIAEQMDEKFIVKLEQLPRFNHLSFEGQSMLFIHYHIEQNIINSPICEDPFSKIVEPSVENMVKLFKKTDANLICFGHHHPVHLFENEKSIYLNPGSLGCNSKPLAPYAILVVTNERIEIELKEAVYKNQEFLSGYELLQVPEREIILKTFHGNQHLG